MQQRLDSPKSLKILTLWPFTKKVGCPHPLGSSNANRLISPYCFTPRHLCPGHALGLETPFPAVSVCSSFHNKIPQTGQLQQQKFIVSQSWRPEVQDQGASRVGFSRSLSPHLVGEHLLPGSSRGFPLGLSVSYCLFLQGHSG